MRTAQGMFELGGADGAGKMGESGGLGGEWGEGVGVGGDEWADSGLGLEWCLRGRRRWTSQRWSQSGLGWTGWKKVVFVACWIYLCMPSLAWAACKSFGVVIFFPSKNVE